MIDIVTKAIMLTVNAKKKYEYEGKSVCCQITAETKVLWHAL